MVRDKRETFTIHLCDQLHTVHCLEWISVQHCHHLFCYQYCWPGQASCEKQIHHITAVDENHKFLGISNAQISQLQKQHSWQQHSVTQATYQDKATFVSKSSSRRWLLRSNYLKMCWPLLSHSNQFKLPENPNFCTLMCPILAFKSFTTNLSRKTYLQRPVKLQLSRV